MTLSTRTLVKVGIVVAAAGLGVLGIISVFSYFTSKDVTFSLSTATQSITVYPASYINQLDDETKPVAVAARQGSGVLRLKPGSYYVVPEGETISKSPIAVEVDDASGVQEVKIDPYRSSDYLSEKFGSEVPTIMQLITDTYPTVIPRYTATNGTFYHFGDWYAATLYENSTTRSAVDIYGIILHKVNEKWTIAATPNILFSYSNYPNIPSDIISAVNQTVSAY